MSQPAFKLGDSPAPIKAPLVVIAAGGTGGHMFPAQAFAVEMRRRGWRVGLVTDARGRRFADNFPAEWVDEVPAATIGAKRPDKLLAAAWRIRSGASLARKRMTSDRPVLVAGFGGYPSFPTLWAARDLRIPIIIHEQNAVLGRVNRAFARAARYVACGFSRLDKLPRAVRGKKRVVGNPVRGAIAEVRDLRYVDPGGDGVVTILVTGGSQGAKLFGKVVPSAVAALEIGMRRRIRVVQQAHADQIDRIRATYGAAGVECELAAFFDDMEARLTSASLVIARAGAGTVAELCVTGRPSVLIPLGIAMDDHQRANAEAVEAVGGADVILEKDFSAGVLAEVLETRLGPDGDLAGRAAAARALGVTDAAAALAELAEDAAGMRPAATRLSIVDEPI